MIRSNRSMLAHPDLVKSITATLAARGIPDQDLRDGVADVQVKTLEFLLARDAPAELGEWRKLCNKIAVAYVTDVLRKKYCRAKYEADLCEDPDAHVADLHSEKERDPVDERRLLGIIEEQLRAAKIPEVAFTILDAEAVGADHAEVAQELGMTRANFDAQLMRMRRAFRARVTLRGMRELLPPLQCNARPGTRTRR
jgi:hypothetical protein